MLEAEGVGLSYGETVALASASATVSAGEIVALVGPSGSGKSTLLYCMSGLVAPDSGTVSFLGQSLFGLGDTARSDLRRKHFGFVFQFAELVPELTLRENVTLPLEINGVGRRERRTRVAELVERLGISAEADRRPSQVSGGQAQRAAVARALVHRPKVVFADEPTGSLDSRNGDVVLAALVDVARQDGTSVVLVTHDEKIAQSADRRLSVMDGRTSVQE